METKLQVHINTRSLNQILLPRPQFNTILSQTFRELQVNELSSAQVAPEPKFT